MFSFTFQENANIPEPKNNELSTISLPKQTQPYASKGVKPVVLAVRLHGTHVVLTALFQDIMVESVPTEEGLDNRDALHKKKHP